MNCTDNQQEEYLYYKNKNSDSISIKNTINEADLSILKDIKLQNIFLKNEILELIHKITNKDSEIIENKFKIHVKDYQIILFKISSENKFSKLETVFFHIYLKKQNLKMQELSFIENCYFTAFYTKKFFSKGIDQYNFFKVLNNSFDRDVDKISNKMKIWDSSNSNIKLSFELLVELNYFFESLSNENKECSKHIDYNKIVDVMLDIETPDIVSIKPFISEDEELEFNREFNEMYNTNAELINKKYEENVEKIKCWSRIDDFNNFKMLSNKRRLKKIKLIHTQNLSYPIAENHRSLNLNEEFYDKNRFYDLDEFSINSITNNISSNVMLDEITSMHNSLEGTFDSSNNSIYGFDLLKINSTSLNKDIWRFTE